MTKSSMNCLAKVHHGMEIEPPRDDTISVCFGPTGSIVANPLTWYVVDECLSSVNICIFCIFLFHSF